MNNTTSSCFLTFKFDFPSSIYWKLVWCLGITLCWNKRLWYINAQWNTFNLLSTCDWVFPQCWSACMVSAWLWFLFICVGLFPMDFWRWYHLCLPSGCIPRIVRSTWEKHSSLVTWLLVSRPLPCFIYRCVAGLTCKVSALHLGAFFILVFTFLEFQKSFRWKPSHQSWWCFNMWQVFNVCYASVLNASSHWNRMAVS